MVQRKFYSLVFEGLGPDIYLEIQTLSRGEVFNIYLDLGYPEQAIIDTDKVSRTKFEDEVYHLGCINRPDCDLPAGIITQTAEQILLYSGFLEGSQYQTDMIGLAGKYAQSTDGRGEALIMTTFTQYKLEDLMEMDNPQFLRLLMSAMIYLREAKSFSAQAYLTGEYGQEAEAPEPTIQQQSESGLSTNWVNKVFGLRGDTATIAGGGVITPGKGHQQWGTRL